MKFFVTALGLVFILEAIPYLLFPEAMQRWLAQLSLVPPAVLRGGALAALGIGLLLCYLTQRTDLIP